MENREKETTIIIIASSPPCEKCTRCKKMAQEMVEKFGNAVKVKILDAMDPEADIYGVVMTPTVIVGDMILSVGSAPQKDKMEKLIAEELGLE